jgi:hypothetical protein
MIAQARDNPALLKWILAISGVAGERPDHAPVELILDGDICARAHVNPSSPIKLENGAGQALLTDDSGSVPVRIVPEPEFYIRRSAFAVPLGDIVCVRGTYANLVLRGGCSSTGDAGVCSLCLGRELTEKAGELWPVEAVVEALRAAFDEGRAESVHINLGYLPGDDAGLSMLRPYLDAIKRHFDTMIVVTMHPPAVPKAIDLSYASGIDMVIYSLDAPDEESMRRHFPGRARFFGRDRYIAALRHAATVFPSGAVWSEIMCDLSPPEFILPALREIASLGALPLIGVSRRQPTAEPDIAALEEILRSQFRTVLEAGISMNWGTDISTAITPLEARESVPDAPQLPFLLNQLTRNRLGAITARSLARLRRKLRVKRVRASLDSSHL